MGTIFVPYRSELRSGFPNEEGFWQGYKAAKSERASSEKCLDEEGSLGQGVLRLFRIRSINHARYSKTFDLCSSA